MNKQVHVHIYIIPFSQVPFDKNELDAILKFGTEELFKEGDKEEDKALKARITKHMKGIKGYSFVSFV